MRNRKARLLDTLKMLVVALSLIRLVGCGTL
jgi:hypothetical protein